MSTAIRADARGGARAAIVDEAARLLREHGRAAVTTRRVAEAAGVQAPTLYRLFGDKDGLLEAVAEHELAAFVPGKAERVAAAEGVDPVADLRASWSVQIGFGVAHPALFALLSDPQRVQRSAAAQSGRRVLAERIHRIALVGRLRVPEERAAELVHAAGTGTILSILATPAELRDPDLAEVMLDAVLQRILIDPGRPEEADGAASAITLRAALPHLEALTAGEQALMGEWLDRIAAAGGPASG